MKQKRKTIILEREPEHSHAFEKPGLELQAHEFRGHEQPPLNSPAPGEPEIYAANPAPDSRAFARAAANHLAPEPEPIKVERESMHIFKHIRLPVSLYKLIRTRFGNLSAYVRYLIYNDLGMTDHAARELNRSRPRI